MERGDKVFMVFCLLALIIVIAFKSGTGDKTAAENARIPGDRIGESVLPGTRSDYGPAYLLSALPRYRQRDDYEQPVSYSQAEFAGNINFARAVGELE